MELKTVYNELKEHVKEVISDFIGVDTNELHNDLFNTSYYIIGYYNASEWLKSHDIDTFELIEHVQDWERDNFGDTNTKLNSESMVNMLVYIVGSEVLWNMEIETDTILTKKMVKDIRA